MRWRIRSVASGVAALLLGAGVAVPEHGNDVEAVRLERLSVSTVAHEEAPLAASEARVSAHEIPLGGDQKHLIVDGTLNGSVRGPMLVDTGASYCVLTRRTARRLGLSRRARRHIPVATANGQIDAQFVRLDAVALSDARLGDVDAVVMDAVEPPLIGIIGLNFLTQFRFSVDLAQGTLRLEP